jgi:hypothetical protein
VKDLQSSGGATSFYAATALPKHPTTNKRIFPAENFLQIPGGELRLPMTDRLAAPL